MASTKINEIIGLLKANQLTTDLYIPSLKRTAKFKHLTAGQQEKFIQALVDNPSIQAKFTTTLIDVIRENCEEKEIFNKLTTIDKYAIGLGLRVHSIGASLKTELNDQPGITYLIDLQKSLENIININLNPLPEVNFDDIKLTLHYPTLNHEYSNEKYFNREQLSLDTPEQIRSIISTAFLGDMLMFIKTFEITKKDNETIKLDFDQVSVQDKVELIRKLPNKLIENMLEPMGLVKNLIETILNTTGVNVDDETNKRNIFITFDSSLFIAAP